MSTESSGRPSEGVNPLPLVVLALLAGGLFVKYPSLESARPIDADRTKPAVAGHQDVEARLWQDPLAAIEREVSSRSATKKQLLVEISDSGNAIRTSLSEKRADDTSHTIDTIRDDIKKRKKSITILAVTVPGGSFDAGAEWRRRARFAVVSALYAQAYVPEQSDALGYFLTKVDNDSKHESVDLEVPYEWFRMDESREQKLANSAHPRAAPVVLVLWINESKLHEPYKNLMNLFEELTGSKQGKELNEKDVNFKLIGPYESKTLRKLIAATPLPRADSNTDSVPPKVSLENFFPDRHNV
jgi:hypothetical protein